MLLAPPFKNHQWEQGVRVILAARDVRFNQSGHLIRSEEAARGQIADKLSQEKANVELRKMMQRLRAQARIDWKNLELRKAWEVGISAEPTF